MSDSSSCDFDEESNWLLDLETALLDNCDFIKLRNICRHRPVPEHLRNEVWKICLNINNTVDAVVSFNDVFDLHNQDLLHEHCREFVASLPKEFFSNSIGFINDIESILTHFSQVYMLEYRENNGWLSILRVLCCELKLTNRCELYVFFTAICNRFLPSAPVLNGDIFSVFRLLLQYHEPELCSFLDTHRISADMFAYDWFSSLLSSQLPHNFLVQLWDITFLDTNPFLMMYLGLVVLLNLREQLLELRGAERSVIINMIRSILPLLAVDDLEDFYGLAQHHASLTPRSLADIFSQILFGNAHKDNETRCLLESLCMPISVDELLDSKSSDLRIVDSVKYFLVDCRPADQYNAGHLPSAYFLDAGLLMSSPGEEFQMSVTALLVTQQQALESNSNSAGEHICFLGSGSDDEDRLVHMVVAQFLRRQTKYVGMVVGGYKAIHEVVGPDCDRFLTNHDPVKCKGCLAGGVRRRPMKLDGDLREMSVESGPERSIGSLVTKFSSAMRMNSARLKQKMSGYVIKNQDHQTKKSAKTYRNTGNIFSIEDDGDDEESAIDSPDNNGLSSTTAVASSPEMINLDLWSRKPDVLRTFGCYVVDDDGSMNPGSLLLTRTNLFVLKRSVSSSKLDGLQSLLGRALAPPVSQNMVTIHRRRTLSHVIKITSKKKIPECLTFHYCVNDDGTVERDRYVLDDAGDAARIIKIQIQKVLDEAVIGD